MSDFSLKQTDQFCLSNSLEHYFKLENAEIKNWQIFLAMNISGFHYNTLQNRNAEILNGISDTPEKLLNNFVTLFKVKLAKCSKNKLFNKKAILAFVDDYDLPYSNTFNKYHNVRFVCLEIKEDNECLIFDNGYKDLALKIDSDLLLSCYEIENKFDAYTYSDYNNIISNAIQNGYLTPNETFANEMSTFITELKQQNKPLDSEILYDLFSFINRSSGPTTTRLQMAESLDFLSTEGDTDVFNDMKMQYHNLSEQWRTIGNLFFRISNNWSKQHFDRIIERLEKIFLDEQKIISYSGKKV
jgi:hypothetical protein